MDIGVLAVAGPGRAADTARRIEALGLHTLLFPDSQNLAPEVWGQLMLAAKATERIRLGPGVSNSITRDAAVTASAALSLQVESGGRAVLGIGRGDSSVQRIGRREDPVEEDPLRDGAVPLGHAVHDDPRHRPDVHRVGERRELGRFDPRCADAR